MTSSRLRKGNCQISLVSVPGGLPLQDFIAFVHRLERVAHAAFAEELRLAEVRVPARAFDPAAHHVAAARHPIDVMRRCAGEVPRISSRTFSVQRSSESRLKIQSYLHVSMARLRSSPKPLNGTCTTRAPSDVAISACAVGAERIDHHHFVGPQHAGNGGGDFLRLVIGQRYRLISSAWSEAAG